MGAFLFYLLKSGCCLVVFYIFFKLLMSRSTFFRFNRITLLVGLLGCTLLPLIELTTTEETFLHTPLYAIHDILQSTESVILNPEQMEDPMLISEKNPEIRSLNWVPVTLAFIYGVGALATFIWLSISTCRLIQLIRTSEKKRFGNYVLVIPQQPTASFSWGKYIVISAADYSQQSEEILLHETMHLRNHHTLDLLFMQIFLLVHWFNPVVWLLKRELQEIHEFEADNGVINTGVDATKYQLLLVKKAVGTRLYSMANGFNHSKLKKRITMMLKERTNRWARLKLLLAVPVMAGALYVFAQPEVKDDLGLQIVQEALQLKPDNDQDIFKFLKDEGEAFYKKSPENAKLKWRVRERQCHVFNIDVKGRIILDGQEIAKEDLKEIVKKRIVENKRRTKQEKNIEEVQLVGVLYAKDTPQSLLVEVLTILKDAFVEIRTDIAKTSGNNSKEYLDGQFPILITPDEVKEERKLHASSNKENTKSSNIDYHKQLNGIDVKIISNDGKIKIKMTNFSLAELKKSIKEFISSYEGDMDTFTVGLKVDKGCQMEDVTEIKSILRSAHLLKLVYQQM